MNHPLLKKKGTGGFGSKGGGDDKAGTSSGNENQFEREVGAQSRVGKERKQRDSSTTEIS